MAFTVLSASAAPTALYSGNVRSEAKTIVDAMEMVGSFTGAPPMDTGHPVNQSVPAVTPDEGVGGMAYDNYLNMLTAQRMFTQTDLIGTTDQTLLIGGDAVRKML